MRWTVALVLALAIGLAAGCGPSYSDLLNEYENEAKELDRLIQRRSISSENHRKIVELSKKMISLVDSPDDAKQHVELLAREEETFPRLMKQFDQEIAKQEKRVDEAWKAKERARR